MKKVLLAVVALLGFAAVADASNQQFVVVGSGNCGSAAFVQRVVVPQRQFVVVNQPQRVVVNNGVRQQVVVNNGGARQQVVVNQGRQGLFQRIVNGNQRVVVQNGAQRVVVK